MLPLWHRGTWDSCRLAVESDLLGFCSCLPSESFDVHVHVRSVFMITENERVSFGTNITVLHTRGKLAPETDIGSIMEVLAVSGILCTLRKIVFVALPCEGFHCRNLLMRFKSTQRGNSLADG